MTLFQKKIVCITYNSTFEEHDFEALMGKLKFISDGESFDIFKKRQCQGRSAIFISFFCVSCV